MDASTSADFDLALFEAQDWATLTVLNPLTLEPLKGVGGKPVEIEMYGPGSEPYARVESQIERDKQANLIQKVTNAGKGAKAAEDEEDSMQRAIRIRKLIACTREIRNFPVAAEALFRNPKLGYIANQANTFMEVWGNFLPGLKLS